MKRAPLLLLAFAALTGAQKGADEEEILVTGFRPPENIIVDAPPHCFRDRNDPLNLFKVVRGLTEQSVVVVDAEGRPARLPDYDPILGPRVWQRAGNAIGDYRFRSLDEPGMVCIGSHVTWPEGYAQLRKIVPADGMHGRFVRFSAHVATRRAERVHFWLAAGKERRAIGGDTRTRPIKGDTGWQQVNVIIGPVPSYATHVSYGFLLHGRGDAWLRDEKLEVLTREEARAFAALPISSVAGTKVPRKP